jgi:hypothetical protein
MSHLVIQFFCKFQFKNKIEIEIYLKIKNIIRLKGKVPDE